MKLKYTNCIIEIVMIVLLSCLIPISVSANRDYNYFQDFSGVLTREQISELDDKLENLNSGRKENIGFIISSNELTENLIEKNMSSNSNSSYLIIHYNPDKNKFSYRYFKLEDGKNIL